LSIQLGLERKIKFIDALDKRQPRDLQGDLNTPLLLVRHFLFQELISKAQMAFISSRF